MKKEIVCFKLDNEFDNVLAYRRAIKITQLAGGNVGCQTNFATAVSEICRNALEFAKEREIVYYIETIKQKSYLGAEINDKGAGIPNIAEILSGAIPLAKNRGRGIVNARRIVDLFTINTSPDGTSVDLKMELYPKKPITEHLIEEWSKFFTDGIPSSPYENIKHRNIQLTELADALRLSEEQYKLLSESVSLMIFSLNKDGELTFVNSWISSYFGLAPDAIIAGPKHSFFYAQEVSFLTKEWHIAKENKTKLEAQIRLKNKKGELIWHELIIIPFIDNGVVLRWVGTCSDIHAQKVIEQTLRENKELQKAQEELKNKIRDLNLINLELEQFAYVASHDLQEPLRKINVFGELLNQRYENVLDETGRMYIDKMSSASHRMKALIEDLLDFSKQSKRLVVFDKVNLNVLIREVLSDMEVIIAEKKAKITIQQLPEIEGDAAQLRRLFQNIISNAIKYSDVSRKPIIRINFEMKENDKVEILIKDNGIGFDQKFLSKIFIIFQRLHAKDTYEGTGIGLALCKRIVENHNGSITAEGQLNKGAMFSLILPVRQVRQV